jgi:competence protein ComEC
MIGFINIKAVKVNNLPVRVEIFFIFAVVNALLFNKLFVINVLFCCVILYLFVEGKVKYIFILCLLILKIFLNYSAIIIDAESANSNGIKYTTTNGKITLSDYYEPGTMLFQNRRNNKSANIVTFKLPLISSILLWRKNFSESLYVKSNGFIKLTQALVVGDRSYIPNEVNDKFIITGLIHLLAISGIHVAMITAILFYLLFFIPKRIKYIIISMFLLFYIPLAAFNVPVNRAAICAVVLMVLFFFDIKVNYRKFLLLIAAFFIMLNPFLIKNLSFLMSFIAVAGIIYLGFNSKNKILNGLFIGFAAQSAIIPITLYTFGMTNVYSVLSTVILLPVINLNIFFGFLSMITPNFFVPLLIFIEKTILYVVNILYLYTYNGFILYKINLYIFITMLCVVGFVFYFTKYRWLIFLIYLLLLIPVKNDRGIYFYKEKKNIIFINLGNKREIYLKGKYYFYKYKLLPLLANMKLKNFDNGNIRVTNGVNLYIKVKKNKETGKICFNKWMEACEVLYKNNVLYVRRYHSKKVNIKDNELYFVPNSSFFTPLNISN